VAPRAVAGIAVGFAIGLFSQAGSGGITFISALFPIPKIALPHPLARDRRGAESCGGRARRVLLDRDIGL
jgi:hypothetical protein